MRWGAAAAAREIEQGAGRRRGELASKAADHPLTPEYHAGIITVSRETGMAAVDLR